MNLHGEWFKFRQFKMADPDAAEKGRLMTAHGMASDPEGRKRMEEEFGLEFCMSMYPEAYKKGFARVLDKAKQMIPW
jgi:hypothetical protein